MDLIDKIDSVDFVGFFVQKNDNCLDYHGFWFGREKMVDFLGFVENAAAQIYKVRKLILMK